MQEGGRGGEGGGGRARDGGGVEWVGCGGCERGRGASRGHLPGAGAGADEKCLRESARVSGRRGRAMATGEGEGRSFKAG